MSWRDVEWILLLGCGGRSVLVFVVGGGVVNDVVRLFWEVLVGCRRCRGGKVVFGLTEGVIGRFGSRDRDWSR